MEVNGPASADLRDIGMIMASDNAVAMDSIVAVMMGCEPGRLRFLQKAKEVGLGDYDPKKIEVIGKLKPIPDFKLPPFGGQVMLQNDAIQTLIKNRTLMRPQADRNLCTGCGTCIDQCTVSALSMGDDNLPIVDADTCISCFCCQELCPEKAIALR
jgi:ferredoxin